METACPTGCAALVPLGTCRETQAGFGRGESALTWASFPPAWLHRLCFFRMPAVAQDGASLGTSSMFCISPIRSNPGDALLVLEIRSPAPSDGTVFLPLLLLGVNGA